MSGSILQTYLNNQFITTDIPEHIENLKKTSTEIQKLLKLKKNKEKIISYTLVALDPTISDEDLVVGEVENIIIKNWPTFKNSVSKVKDKPITYIQAVILDALDDLSKDENIAAIIWHTGCNIVNHYNIVGQEEILTSFLMKVGQKVEKVARTNWKITDNANNDPIQSQDITLPKVIQSIVNENKLTEHLLAAAVHTAWKDTAGGGENPAHTGTANHIWPKFFAERAAEGITKEINGAMSSQGKSLTSFSTSLQESINLYFTDLNLHFEKIASSILQSSQSLKIRSDLLWWKESLYSKKLDLSYRKIEPLVVAKAMATDLADNVSPIYPRSVDFFLKETLRKVIGDETDKVFELVTLLEQTQKFSGDIKELLNELCTDCGSRISFGSGMANIVQGKINSHEFFILTGLDKNTKITLEALSIWLFHDIQANKLVKAS